MAKAFVSYKHADPDQRLAGYFAEALRQHGHDVFMDTQIQVGQPWPAIIKQKLEESDFVIVLLSEQASSSEMIIEEVAISDQLKKEHGRPIILPVRIAYIGDLPYDVGARLNRLQYVLWTQDGDEIAILERLRQALEQDQPLQQAMPVVQAGGATMLATDGNEVRLDQALVSPLPAFDSRALEKLESPEGAIQLRSRFYIERQIDQRIKDLIVKEGVTIRIKGGGQTGKTSLLARLHQHARQQQLQVLYIDFQLLDDQRLQDLDTLLRYLANLIAARLKTNQSPSRYWQSELGSKDKLTEFLTYEVLDQTQIPLVLLLDKVDRLFKFGQYRDDFFSLIRSWHNNRAFDPLWDKLNLVLAYSTEAFMFIADLNQSPFNVGDDFELVDFDRVQVAELNQRHGDPVRSEQDMDSLTELLQGHPFLVRKALYELIAQNLTVAQLLQRAHDDDGPFSDHLHRYLLHLNQLEGLGDAMQSVIRSHVCPTDLTFYQLRAAGLVRGPNRTNVRPRCGLYETYFGRHL